MRHKHLRTKDEHEISLILQLTWLIRYNYQYDFGRDQQHDHRDNETLIAAQFFNHNHGRNNECLFDHDDMNFTTL